MRLLHLTKQIPSVFENTAFGIRELLSNITGCSTSQTTQGHVREPMCTRVLSYTVHHMMRAHVVHHGTSNNACLRVESRREGGGEGDEGGETDEGLGWQFRERAQPTCNVQCCKDHAGCQEAHTSNTPVATRG
jgi:hypothetical protein